MGKRYIEVALNRMASIHTESTLLIDARPEDVYAVLADYHVGHAAIVPKPYFEEVAVERGGTGAGTGILVRMNVLGTRRVLHMEVTEPQPGRVIVETDAAEGIETTFTVEPRDGGAKSQVTIAVDARTRGGVSGFFERLVVPIIMRRIFSKELRQLNEYMRTRPPAHA